MKYRVEYMQSFKHTVDMSFLDKDYAHSSHLKEIMLHLDAIYADLISITVIK